MDITQVKVFPVNEDKLKAFVSVVFDHCFMVNDIKIIQGKDGLFLSMPSRRKKSGEFKDVAHPLNNETRRLLEERVLTEYRDVVDDPTPRRPDHEGEQAGAASTNEETAPPKSVEPPPAGEGGGEKAEKTLEEVQEMHLRDSFWSVS